MGPEVQPEDEHHIKISRVIPKAYTKQLAFQKYVVAIAEPKKTNLIISALKLFGENHDPQNKQKMNQKEHGQLLKQEENVLNKQRQKSFLKRVRKSGQRVQVIICKQANKQKDSIVFKLKNMNLLQQYTIKQLPAETPLTQQQFEQWAKIWPINFVKQEIARQIVHSSASIKLIQQIYRKQKGENNNQIFLLDNNLKKVLYSGSFQKECMEGQINHPIMTLLSKWPLSQQFSTNSDKYYYLTGLKMLVTKKLCGMCSMALVHSRLHSIYMDFEPSPTMDQIMGCPKLNHQIIMFVIS